MKIKNIVFGIFFETTHRGFFHCNIIRINNSNNFIWKLGGSLWGNFVAVYLNAEVYLETSQTFTVELFCENSLRLLAINYFRKNPLSYMFIWVLIHLCVSYHWYYIQKMLDLVWNYFSVVKKSTIKKIASKKFIFQHSEQVKFNFCMCWILNL